MFTVSPEQLQSRVDTLTKELKQKGQLQIVSLQKKVHERRLKQLESELLTMSLELVATKKMAAGELEETVMVLRASLADARREFRIVETERDAATMESQSAQEALTVARGQIEMLKQARRVLEEQCTALQSEKRSATERVEEYERQREQASAEIERIRSSLSDEFQTLIQKETQKSNALYEAIKQLESRLESTKTNEKETKSRLDESEEVRARLSRDLNEAVGRMRERDGMARIAEETIRELSSKYEGARQEQARMADELTVAGTELRRRDKTMAELTERCETLERELEDARRPKANRTQPRYINVDDDDDVAEPGSARRTAPSSQGGDMALLLEVTYPQGPSSDPRVDHDNSNHPKSQAPHELIQNNEHERDPTNVMHPQGPTPDPRVDPSEAEKENVSYVSQPLPLEVTCNERPLAQVTFPQGPTPHPRVSPSEADKENGTRNVTRVSDKYLFFGKNGNQSVSQDTMVTIEPKKKKLRTLAECVLAIKPARERDCERDRHKKLLQGMDKLLNNHGSRRITMVGTPESIEEEALAAASRSYKQWQEISEAEEVIQMYKMLACVSMYQQYCTVLLERGRETNFASAKGLAPHELIENGAVRKEVNKVYIRNLIGEVPKDEKEPWSKKFSKQMSTAAILCKVAVLVGPGILMTKTGQHGSYNTFAQSTNEERERLLRALQDPEECARLRAAEEDKSTIACQLYERMTEGQDLIEFLNFTAGTEKRVMRRQRELIQNIEHESDNEHERDPTNVSDV